jgi:hypothetical protein
VKLTSRIALLILCAGALYACSDKSNPSGADAVATPSPPASSPSPVATPDAACAPHAVTVAAALDEPGKRDKPIYAWGVGQVVILQARITNIDGQPLAPSCHVPSDTVWTRFGAPVCGLFGNVTSAEVRLSCTTGGDLEIQAHTAGLAGDAVYIVVSGETESRKWWRIDQRPVLGLPLLE